MSDRLVSVDSVSLEFPPAIQSKLDVRYRGAGDSIVNVSFYGTAGDGVTDDTAAIQAAIDAVADGGTVVIPGGVYALDGTLVNNGKSVRVSAHGATFVKDTGTAAVSFTGAYDPTVAVSACVASIITGTSQGVTLTVSGTMPWKRGDVVKVFSSDVLPETLVDVSPPASSTARSGQFFTVYSVASNSVVLLGDLIDPLTTTVRAARLQDISCVWEGGNFTVTDNYVTSNFLQGGFTYSTMRGPVIRDVSVSRSGSSAFAMVGNYGYLIDNPEVRWVQDDSVNGHFGYGVTDTVSAFGVVSGGRFIQPRHGYTTNYSATTASEDSPRKYGRTYGAKIINTVVTDSSNSAFDTHSDGEDIQFIGCTAINPATGSGFHLRGRRNKVFNGTVKRAPIGVRTASDSEAGQSHGHVINGLSVDTVATVVQMVTRGGGTHPNAGVRDTRSNTIRNVNARNVTSEGLDLTNVTVDVDGFNVEYTGTVSSGLDLNLVANSQLVAGRIKWDHTGVGAGSGADLFAVNGANVCEITDLRVINTNTTSIGALVNIVSGGPSVRVDVVADYLPTTPYAGSLGSNSWMKYSAAVGVSNPSSARTAITNATIANDLIQAVSRRRDPFLALDVTGGTQTLAALPNQQAGCLLIISNTAASSGSLTVQNGSTPNTLLNGASNKVLTAGQSILLRYDGSIWVQTSLI